MGSVDEICLHVFLCRRKGKRIKWTLQPSNYIKDYRMENFVYICRILEHFLTSTEFPSVLKVCDDGILKRGGADKSLAL
jgi:hypothetical protein